jgi:hypothetical protein
VVTESKISLDNAYKALSNADKSTKEIRTGFAERNLDVPSAGEGKAALQSIHMGHCDR